VPWGARYAEVTRWELVGFVLGPTGAWVADPASWGPLLVPLLIGGLLAMCVWGYRAAGPRFDPAQVPRKSA
jgi:hypothetical protein